MTESSPNRSDLMITTASIAAPLIAAGAAILGVVIGLLAPLLAGRVENKRRRRENERRQCERILELFEEQVDATYQALTANSSPLRRKLLLRSGQLKDEEGRELRADLVDLATDPNSTREDVLNKWTETVSRLSTVYRSLI